VANSPKSKKRYTFKSEPVKKTSKKEQKKRVNSREPTKDRFKSWGNLKNLLTGKKGEKRTWTGVRRRTRPVEKGEGEGEGKDDETSRNEC